MSPTLDRLLGYEITIVDRQGERYTARHRFAEHGPIEPQRFVAGVLTSLVFARVRFNISDVWISEIRENRDGEASTGPGVQTGTG